MAGDEPRRRPDKRDARPDEDARREAREPKRARRDRESDRSPPRDSGRDEAAGAGAGGGSPPDPGRASPPGRAGAEEAGGEVSLSVEETNRLRVSLGLKPLTVGNAKAEAEAAAGAAAAAKRAEEAKAAKEAELAERVKAQRERRLEQESLRKVKTLGAAGEDVDDLGAWVARSRDAETRAKAAAKAAAAKLAAQLDAQDGGDEEAEEEEERGEAGASARELAGMRVKHSAEELGEGETMILTLADRSILDARGEIDEDAEELENALAAEDKARRKAFKAAAKEHKPLFGEDGKVRGLLDKYDEEEAEAGMRFDADGEVERAARQEAVRARLRAAESAATAAAGPSFASGGDFYSTEEMEQFQKPKTKKKRKLRKKADEGEGAQLLAALEREAAAADTGADRGSRAQRAERDAARAAASAAEQQQRRQRYEHALDKANAASAALRPSAATAAAAEAQAQAAEEEADEDLQASLARARRAVQARAAAAAEAQAPERIAAAAAARREARERAEAEHAGGLEFSEAKDFANSIQLVEPEQAAQQAAVKAEEPAEPEAMDTAEPAQQPAAAAPAAAAAMPPPPPRPPPQASNGGWVSTDRVKAEAGSGDVEMAPPPPPPPPASAVKQEPDADKESLVRERNVGTGLAGAMALLRERGELAQKVEWAGRTNDTRHRKLEDLGDVYAGGSHEDRVAADIEQALTERDEFGRVLTPKERFRRLCHNFHGKTISKSKQEKRLRKLQEEVDARRAATAEGSAAAFARVGGQQIAGTPYMVLSGRLQPGQSSDPASGFATVERQVAPTPVHGSQTPRLGGGITPLVGDSKVELMLGLRREGGAAPQPLRKG